LAREARIKVKTIPDPDQRWAIQSNIILWEKQSAEYQAKADEYYVLVKKLETGKSAENKVPAAIKKDTIINDLAIYKFKPPQDVPVIPAKTAPTAVVAVNEVVAIAEKPVDKVKPSPKKVEEGNQFAVLEKSPYSAGNPIPADIAIPSGAFYRIQLGVFSKKVKWDAFGGLSPITSESVAGKPVTRYYTGKFTNFESAKAALNIVKSKGYKDGFIAAWYNGQKLAAEKVVEFEKRDRK
jgi:hypothetical protein